MPPAKKVPSNEENIALLYREVLKIVDVKDLKSATEGLEGEDLKAFALFCNQTYNDPFFSKILKGFIFDQVMMTAEVGLTADQYWNGKLIVVGAETIRQYFAKYASMYDQMVAKEEEFDPHASFNKPQV